jgi:hypothetical protein
MQYLMDVWIVEVALKSLHLMDLGCWISADSSCIGTRNLYLMAHLLIGGSEKDDQCET